ncbi:hypothetical protein WAF17_16320 [Bernardetia sp. ABR2-2B]|uniref:hypothetical protein n=1 Tax=Bernardetia sp. ABR2-2B TaxID=3127472 RepID=UPI0030D18DCC
MEAELKIVGGVIIAIMFFANTGIGIWIYRIMKSSEKVDTLNDEIDKTNAKITKIEEKARNDRQDLLDKINSEREERIKFEARIKQNEKDISNLRNELSRNSQRFIEIAQKFEISITHLNTSMENFSGILKEVKEDLKEIKTHSEKR